MASLGAAAVVFVQDGLTVRSDLLQPFGIDRLAGLAQGLVELVHRLAAENRTEAQLKAIAREMQAFENSIETGNGVIRSETNLAFHKAIAAAAGNPYISDFYETALIGTIRLARACFSGAQEFGTGEPDAELQAHLAKTVGEHRNIYDAIQRRDVEAADRLAVDHYLLTKQRIMKVLSAQSPALAGMGDLSLDSWARA